MLVSMMLLLVNKLRERKSERVKTDENLKAYARYL